MIPLPSERRLTLLFQHAAQGLCLLCLVLASLTAPASAHGQFRRDSGKLDLSLDEYAESSSPSSMRFAPARTEGPDYHVQRVDPNTLVVYRARVGSAGLEGFLVDETRLLDTLHQHVLEERGLGDVARFVASPKKLNEAQWLVFPYHFQAPFTSLSTHLSLRRLDADSEETLLGSLAAFLAAAIVGGLLALYRMVRVQMEFAERRNNFVSAVSHELKTPLTAIRMYGEILREGLVDDDRKRAEYYGLITSESERLSRLVNNVLELSDIERTKKQRPLLRGDLSVSLRQAVEVMQGQAKERGFDLALHLGPGLPAVEHDPDGLKQVLFNLIENALKYGREGQVRKVEVRCECAVRGVTIAVRDFGPGVNEALLPRLFEPFFRGENELTRRHEGVGLGLTLVKRIADSMQAEVTCRNAQPGFEVLLRFQA